MNIPSLASKWPILVNFCVVDHQKSKFSTDFSLFPVGGCRGQPMFFENWLMKLKCPNLLKSLGIIFQQNYWSFYPSEPFTKNISIWDTLYYNNFLFIYFRVCFCKTGKPCFDAGCGKSGVCKVDKQAKCTKKIFGLFCPK